MSFRLCLLWLRLPALTLLLLMVLANPVLAAVGGLHEATHGVASHLHETGDHALADDGDDHDEAGDLLRAQVPFNWNRRRQGGDAVARSPQGGPETFAAS